MRFLRHTQLYRQRQSDGRPKPDGVAQINAGAQADVSINLTAPTPTRRIQGTWQPRTSDGAVMENLVVKIKVSADAAPLAGAVTGHAARPAGSNSCSDRVADADDRPGLHPAYNDRDGDGQQGNDENLLAGVVFTLSDAGGPKDSYTTDGVSEPH